MKCRRLPSKPTVIVNANLAEGNMRQLTLGLLACLIAWAASTAEARDFAKLPTPVEVQTKLVTINFEANTVAQKLSDSHSLCTLTGMFRWEGSSIAAPATTKAPAPALTGPAAAIAKMNATLRQISTTIKDSVAGYGCTVEKRDEKGKSVWYARAEIKAPHDKTAGKLTCSFACINAVYYK
jgi:hypothetical protein